MILVCRNVLLLTTICIHLVLPLPPKKQTNFDYKEALRLSLLFYEAQRSGYLPKDNKIAWRENSALNDVGQNGEDLVGGYYDGKG